MDSPKVELNAIRLRQIATKFFAARRFAVHNEVSLNKAATLRADIVATNTAPYIIVCEIKSSVADFKSDKKWHKYLDFCNQFYFCMSDKTYAKVKDLIPKSVGVLVISADLLTLRIFGRSTKRTVEVKNQLTVLGRCSYRSADVKLSARKNEKNGASLIASDVIDSLVNAGKLKKATRANKALVFATLRPYL